MSDVHPTRRVVDLLTGAWQAQALHAAAVLDLPDHIHRGRGTTAELADATGCEKDGIERLMRLLTAMGVFTGGNDEGYRLTEVGDLLRTDHARSMRDMAVIYGEEFHRAWGAVVPAVRTGVSGFRHAFGVTLGEHLAADPGAAAGFQRAMNAGNVFFQDVLRAHDFGADRTVVDVAGGGGMLLSTILAAHPDLRGVLLDLPHVVPVADAHLTRELGPGRHLTVAGDIFDSVPGGGDVYLLSRILQDWDDEHCLRLLTSIRRAMPATARLLIVERVIPTDGSALLPLLWDLHLLMAAGGRERTLDGYRSLLDGAGLRLESVTEMSLETSLLTAVPAEENR
ncbi:MULTISPECIES: methyltransferase [Streptomyces]|uniref:Methyltransferase n=1 Tax=Streptomyces parvus TaxID=66428 RepID=A0A5D4JIU0_9ACTN|nr:MULTISPECIES: methyltransferase [Streptomyces]PVD03517.1 methyltransferase [Streptomyces sp. CS014]TYR65202.1 methyltransferase [Streptomyces parvus]